MKKRTYLSALPSFLYAVLLVLAPITAFADEVAPPPPGPEPIVLLAPILITEVQTGLAGSGNASKEFIELYNTTDESIDLSTWQLWYISATADNLNQPTKRIIFSSESGESLLLPSHEHLVLSGNPSYLTEQRNALYEATLAVNGRLRLFYRTDDYLQTCRLLAADSVSWGTVVPASGASPAPAPGESLARLRTAEGQYIDSELGTDFLATTMPTPSTQNSSVGDAQSLAYSPLELADPGCTPVDDPSGSATPPSSDSPPSITTPPEGGESEGSEETQPSIPESNTGLKPPQMSELLPNPASPQTDAQDEFIELYNPNDTTFDLSGYVLEAGTATKHRYVIPAGTIVQPHAFYAFFSGDTHLSLSNTQGQVRLIDPLGTLLAQSDPYASAKDGQSWLLANGSWQWTIKPTPNALNVVSVPVSAKKTAAAKSKKSSASKVKAATTAKPKKATEAKDEAQTTATATAAGRSPLHPAVLALIAAPALLYGAYEYRRDVANKFYQFRSNRAARAAARQSAKGR